MARQHTWNENQGTKNIDRLIVLFSILAVIVLLIAGLDVVQKEAIFDSWFARIQ